ncbi:MAG TPA: response regulator, partial [Usitatibacter sp.]|nr:response regulator [Usitatibacter sp.]
MKVLLVDDHHLIREGMRPVLEKLAADDAQAVAEVFEAATFEKAIDTIERHPDLDLVLLDLRLPGVTHFDALDRLRSRYPALPVVLMSGDE